MIPRVVFRGRLRVFSVHLASPSAAKAHYSLFVFRSLRREPKVSPSSSFFHVRGEGGWGLGGGGHYTYQNSSPSTPKRFPSSSGGRVADFGGSLSPSPYRRERTA